MKNLFLSMLAMAAMVSCTNEIVDNGEKVDNGQPVPVKLNAGIGSITTKSPIIESSTFDAQVFASATDGVYTTAEWTDATAGYITISNKAVTFVTPQFYPADGSKIYMKGFTPRGTVAEGKVAYEITGAEDIMVTKTQIEGSKTANTQKTLAFDHLLTQLQVKTVAKDQGAIDAWGTITSITVNADKKLELDLLDNSLAAATAAVKADLPLYSFTAGSALTTEATSAGDIMVLARSEAYSLSITTSKSVNPVSVTITPEITESSKAHVITLTFNSAEVTATATIGEWKTGAEGGAEVN